jgi:hypothetical protein
MFFKQHALVGEGDRVANPNDDAEIANNLMTCLIENKRHHDMPEKCRAGIEHHQLVNIYHLTLCHQLSLLLAFLATCLVDCKRLHCVAYDMSRVVSLIAARQD